MHRSAILSSVAVMLVLVACSSDDASSSSDPAASCKDICTNAGFTGSRVDTQPNEVNCFCSGGTGEVTAAICTDGCKAQGKMKSQPFKSGAAAAKPDSCQCS